MKTIYHILSHRNMTTDITVAKGELMGIVWLNHATDTIFILLHKINVITTTIRFVRFINPQPELLEKLRETHSEHIPYVTRVITYGLYDPTKYEYVPIPEGFVVYNNTHHTLDHVVSSTGVVVQHKYAMVAPTDAEHYQLIWKQQVSESDRKPCPDRFTFMYQSKPIHEISNVITDQWKQIYDRNNHSENWSITYY